MVRDRIIVERASDIEKEGRYPKSPIVDLVQIRGTEKRIILGKARTCKMANGKVNEVFDELSEQYLPLNRFLKLFNENGKRIELEEKVKEEKKLEIPVNAITTAEVKLSTSGVPGIDVQVPEVQGINVGVDIKKDKEKIEDVDPFDWYLKRILRRT